MSESRKLIKKAVLAGVGASNSVERIKSALTDAMQDLVKVGNDLFDEMEDKGKEKTENVQNFLRNLQDEASKRSVDAEKKVSSKVQNSTKKAAKELGLITREEADSIIERLTAVETALGITHVAKNDESNHEEEAAANGEDSEAKKTRKKKQNGDSQ